MVRHNQATEVDEILTSRLPRPNPGSIFSLSAIDNETRLGPNRICAFRGTESIVRVRLNVLAGLVGEGERKGSEESISNSGQSSFTGLANRLPLPGDGSRPVDMDG